MLGVSRDATLDEIKRAFRGRAKEFHPDTNSGDKDTAERFKDVSAAYEILTDPEKRAHYMRGDWDPWRDGDWGGAHGRSDDIVFDKEFGPGDREADLFGDIAGNRRGRGGTSMIIQGDDMAEDLSVAFIEAAVGVRKQMELITGATVELNVPPGIADGEVLRVPGYGFPGLGGAPPGDLNITVAVTPHEVLNRDTFDIRMDLEVADTRLRDGARVRVPTIGGEMALEIPAGAEPGQVLRLRGMGIRDRVSGRRGDQYVRLATTIGSSTGPTSLA